MRRHRPENTFIRPHDVCRKRSFLRGAENARVKNAGVDRTAENAGVESVGVDKVWKAVRILCQSSVVYIDSTIRVVPSLFYELFTIFVPHAEHTIPVRFAFMSRKTTALYEAVFHKVHEVVPQFQPTQLIADFEEAPDAIVFGNNLTVSGCWFHVTQAQAYAYIGPGESIERRLLSADLVLFRCPLSLPLLPVDVIRPGFEEVKSLF